MQRFGSALNLNTHLRMLRLDGVYALRPDGGLRFARTKTIRFLLFDLITAIADSDDAAAKCLSGAHGLRAKRGAETLRWGSAGSD